MARTLKVIITSRQVVSFLRKIWGRTPSIRLHIPILITDSTISLQSQEEKIKILSKMSIYYNTNLFYA